MAPRVPTRRGYPKTLTYDHDAVALLATLCPSKMDQGKFVSELIRTEAKVREERARLKAAMLALFDPDAPATLDAMQALADQQAQPR